MVAVPVQPRPGAAPTPRRIHAAHRATGAAVVLGTAASLTACAPVISVPPGEDATNPTCAVIVLATPDELGGLERIDTDSQATTAWGEPQRAITLRCGVPVPGPTTEQCQTITDLSGTAVDWLVRQEDATQDWIFTTYGREPAVEVRVPPDVPTAPVVDLNAAVIQAEQTRQCY